MFLSRDRSEKQLSFRKTLRPESLSLANQKLWWKLKREERANFSKPERIAYIQECGLLGSLSRSIDMAGKETGGGGGGGGGGKEYKPDDKMFFFCLCQIITFGRAFINCCF